MLFLSASIIMVLLIILSYLLDRNFPQYRKVIFASTVFSLCLVSILVFYLSPIKPLILSREQQQSIILQQKSFIPWYNNYQQELNIINTYANNYDTIYDDYIKGKDNINSTISSLKYLYNETNSYQKEMDLWEIPEELNENNKNLTIEIIRSTKVYFYHINETIRQSITILEEAKKKKLPKRDIINNLVRIRALEYPILLDNSKYIYQIRENLRLEEIGENKNK